MPRKAVEFYLHAGPATPDPSFFARLSRSGRVLKSRSGRRQRIFVQTRIQAGQGNKTPRHSPVGLELPALDRLFPKVGPPNCLSESHTRGSRGPYGEVVMTKKWSIQFAAGLVPPKVWRCAKINVGIAAFIPAKDICRCGKSSMLSFLGVTAGGSCPVGV